MIAGIIVLTLFLTALTAMVVLTQQYDAYQSTVNTLSQKDVDRFSENVKPVYPGLKGGFLVTGCGSHCNQYNMSLTNVGGIGVQIARIYINSTQQTTGCTITNNDVKSPCTLDGRTDIEPFSFSSYDSFIMPGEINHIVRLWLPQTITLPNVTLTPSNTIWVVTTRGRVFSFGWPFSPAGQGLPGKGTPPTMFVGLMRVAYTGTPDSNAGALPQHDSYHQEQRKQLPIGGGNYLYFVKPWITNGQNGCPNVLGQASSGKLYVAAYGANTLSFSLQFNWGYMVILAADSSSNAKVFYMGGPLYGVVYNDTLGNQQFFLAGTSNPPYATIPAGHDFYLIYKVINVDVGSLTDPGDTFSGTATVNNGYGSQNQGPGFRAVEVFLDGVFVRTRCTP
jgi:hypothetical protein